MAEKSAEERTEKYMARVCRRRAGPTRAKIEAGVFLAFARQVEIETATRTILAGERVITMDYPKYYAFALQVSRLVRLSCWSDLPAETKARVVAKYEGWGCQRAVLVKILDLVFQVIEPPRTPSTQREGPESSER